MPLLTNLIDDKSPLIAYDATWRAGTAQDPLATDYYLGTFTVNNVTDGAAEFSFNGTAVWIYGANRPNHGSYTVQIDGETFSGLNGAGNNLFQQTIFNISSLNQGTHSLKLTNTASGGLYVDIDMIMWQSQVGNVDDQLVVEVVQDTDPRFQYQEPAWSATSSVLNFGLFSNGTGQACSPFNAACRLSHSLSGEAISLFGTSGPNNGPYSAQLDGGPTAQYNAFNTYPNYYGVMLYHADNLGPGLHELVLTNLPATNGQSLSIDYAQLWTIASVNSTSAMPPNPVSVNTTQNSKLDLGAIVGIIVATVAAVLSAGAALFLYRRWKAAMVAQQDLYRAYVAQQRPLSSTTVAPTGFSSSLDTRNTPSQTMSGNARRTANNHDAQHNGLFPVVYPPSPSPQFVADESLECHPLLEVVGGGLASANVASNAPPPNYTQAIGNVPTAHE